MTIDINTFTQYIRPELVVLPFMLYALGIPLKKTPHIPDHFIPYILGFISLAISAIYVLAVSPTPQTYQEVLALVFDIIVQGVCCAAASVYVNQLYKQFVKMKAAQAEQKSVEENNES